jgi:hypothetical protein
MEEEEKRRAAVRVVRYSYLLHRQWLEAMAAVTLAGLDAILLTSKLIKEHEVQDSEVYGAMIRAVYATVAPEKLRLVSKLLDMAVQSRRTSGKKIANTAIWGKPTSEAKSSRGALFGAVSSAEGGDTGILGGGQGGEDGEAMGEMTVVLYLKYGVTFTKVTEDFSDEQLGGTFEREFQEVQAVKREKEERMVQELAFEDMWEQDLDGDDDDDDEEEASGSQPTSPVSQLLSPLSAKSPISQPTTPNHQQTGAVREIEIEPRPLGIKCNGTVITGVAPGSQAEKQGVKVGWQVVAIAGNPVRTTQEVTGALMAGMNAAANYTATFVLPRTASTERKARLSWDGEPLLPQGELAIQEPSTGSQPTAAASSPSSEDSSPSRVASLSSPVSSPCDNIPSSCPPWKLKLQQKEQEQKARTQTEEKGMDKKPDEEQAQEVQDAEGSQSQKVEAGQAQRVEDLPVDSQAHKVEAGPGEHAHEVQVDTKDVAMDADAMGTTPGVSRLGLGLQSGCSPLVVTAQAATAPSGESTNGKKGYAFTAGAVVTFPNEPVEPVLPARLPSGIDPRSFVKKFLTAAPAVVLAQERVQAAAEAAKLKAEGKGKLSAEDLTPEAQRKAKEASRKEKIDSLKRKKRLHEAKKVWETVESHAAYVWQVQFPTSMHHTPYTICRHHTHIHHTCGKYSALVACTIHHTPYTIVIIHHTCGRTHCSSCRRRYSLYSPSAALRSPDLDTTQTDRASTILSMKTSTTRRTFPRVCAGSAGETL